jgi:hypothetical protein
MAKEDPQSMWASVYSPPNQRVRLEQLKQRTDSGIEFHAAIRIIKGFPILNKAKYGNSVMLKRGELKRTPTALAAKRRSIPEGEADEGDHEAQ